MRILRLLISAFVLFLIFSVGGFFLFREILLFWGSNSIRNSLKTLGNSKNKNLFVSQCVELGATHVQGDSLVTYQLRFLSSSEYLLEASCEGFSYEPITIAQAKLPQFVTKVPGTSGFFISRSEQSGIEIEVFRLEIDKLTETTGIDFSFLEKKKVLVAEDAVLIHDVSEGYVGNGPVTVCEGYGYQCCDPVAEFGVGDRIIGLTDCESQCYGQCASRPLVLSFNTNPILDPRTREVEITSGTTVEFTYVADAGQAELTTGILDFGDGKKAQISGLAGQTAHTYECRRSSCEYSARVILEDNWGVKSADLGISKVKIIITR
jgi:hypothetical protein